MIRCKGNSWFCRWRENSVQRQKHFGTGPEAKMKAELYDAEIKLAKKRGQSIPGNKPRTGLYFDELGQLYVDQLRASGRSVGHIRNMVTLLNGIYVPGLPDKPVSEFMFEDVLAFAGRFEGKAQSTRNRYMDYLNAILNFGVSAKLIPENPMAGWKKPREAKRDVQLTVEDLGRIIAAAEPHLARALDVGFNTGVRTGESELLALKWSQVDFAQSEIKVYAPKTRTWRVIPLKPEFLERLKSMKAKAATAYVIEFKNKPVKSLRRSFKTACEKAGIDYPVRFYDVRHLYCTTLLNNGADLAAVSKLMGHSTIKMTADTYYHFNKIEQARAVGLLPNISKQP